jgi:hypothetical protein
MPEIKRLSSEERELFSELRGIDRSESEPLLHLPR